MRKLLLVVMTTLALTGCASMDGVIPSFWDDNQSAKAIDIRVAVSQLDCEKPQHPQAKNIQGEIQWFVYYSEAKGYLQKDVLKLMQPMKDTVDDFVNRTQEKDASVTYCNIKKKLMTEQATMVSKGVLGRY